MHIVLERFGTQLLFQDGLLLVTTLEGDKQSFPPGEVRSIVCSKGIRLSSTAILACIDHEIDLTFAERNGQPKGRIWSYRYGSIASIRRHQLQFAELPAGLDYIKSLLAEKLARQGAVLTAFVTDLEACEAAHRRLNRQAQKIKNIPGTTLAEAAESLRGHEGAAGRAYFAALSAAMPPEFAFSGRSRPARDAFNSMLNYTYGILYARVEYGLVRAGLDPYAGLLHRDEYNRPSLVYDCIERYRAWADYVVCYLCQQQVVEQDFFTVSSQGVYWLEGYGKRIVIQTLNDYLDEVVVLNGQSRSRLTHLQQDAYSLAASLKNMPSAT